MVVELIKDCEIEETCDMIQKTCKESFVGYYPEEWVKYTISRQIEKLKK